MEKRSRYIRINICFRFLFFYLTSFLYFQPRLDDDWLNKFIPSLHIFFKKSHLEKLINKTRIWIPPRKEKYVGDENPGGCVFHQKRQFSLVNETLAYKSFNPSACMCCVVPNGKWVFFLIIILLSLYNPKILTLFFFFNFIINNQCTIIVGKLCPSRFPFCC
jgi:hypothetical protein